MTRGTSTTEPMGATARWAWQAEDAPATPCERCREPAEPARFHGRGSVRSRWCGPCRDALCEADDRQFRADRLAAMSTQERLLRAKRAEVPAGPLAFLVREAGPDDTPALLMAHEWLGGDAKFLVLAGAPGCGKTVAACYALWHRPRSGLFVYAGKLAQRSWFDEADWRELERVHLLVIDDLGQEPADKGGHSAAKIDTLLTIREGSRLRTVVTTNLDEVRFGERYGQRLMDRLHGSGVWFADSGASKRGPLAPREQELPF